MENSADLFPSSEIALAEARISNAMNPADVADSINPLILAAPANLTAPSAVVLAATLFKTAPGIRQLSRLSFSLIYTTSGAGSLAIAVKAITNATAFAGGDNTQSKWRFENGGTPVTVTGDAAVTIATPTQSSSGAGAHVLTWSTLDDTPGTMTVGYELVATSAQTITAMVLNATVEIVGQ